MAADFGGHLSVSRDKAVATMLGELNSEQIEGLLLSETIGRIGCHAEGLTYVVPVTYVYDGARIIGHTGEGLKVRLMRKNPQVCFEIDQVDNLANWRSVIVWGSFKELHGAEAATAMSLLIDRVMPLLASATVHPQGQPLRPGAEHATGHPTVVFCIQIKEKTGRFEKR